MNYATIKPWDIANGPGVRVSVFVSGCTHRCKNCFNAEAWDFNYGEPFDEAVMDRIVRLAQPDYIRGVTYVGGEPFDPRNHAGLLEPVAPGWGLRAVRNPRPEDGMFSSICTGLQAVLDQAREDGVAPEQGGVFVHPVDVPLTRRLTLLALLRTADAVPWPGWNAGRPGILMNVCCWSATRACCVLCCAIGWPCRGPK